VLSGPLPHPEGVLALMAEDGRRTMAMENLRARLARADLELDAAIRLLDPKADDEAEIDLVRAIANARTSVGDALETIRAKLGEPP
jgi:hypothetical protein